MRHNIFPEFENFLISRQLVPEKNRKPGSVRANDKKLKYNAYMRREQITYIGAYHHVMNRGYGFNDIFTGNNHKSHFLNYLEVSAKRMKIRIFDYCIFDNHYHLVLENSSGRMSDFCKLLNGQYGMYFRKMEGGHRKYNFSHFLKLYLTISEKNQF